MSIAQQNEMHASGKNKNEHGPKGRESAVKRPIKAESSKEGNIIMASSERKAQKLPVYRQEVLGKNHWRTSEETDYA